MSKSRRFGCSSGGVSQSSHGAWKDAPQQNQAFKDIVASYLPFVWLQAQHGRCEVSQGLHQRPARDRNTIIAAKLST
jgi:hypothetical protein